MKILETNDLKKYYGEGDMQVKALDGVNLSVEEGEFAAVVGTSGSGKSTLLHMLGGLDYATSGTVTVAGKKIFELNERELTIFRRRQIGFIFQSYNLVPILSVYENIVLPLELDGTARDSEFDKVTGLDLGADDYIAKPFGMSELVSRINAVLRRCRRSSEDEKVYRIGGLAVYPERHIAELSGKDLSLSYKEFELLLTLLEAEGKAVTREELFTKTYG